MPCRQALALPPLASLRLSRGPHDTPLHFLTKRLIFQFIARTKLGWERNFYASPSPSASAALAGGMLPGGKSGTGEPGAIGAAILPGSTATAAAASICGAAPARRRRREPGKSVFLSAEEAGKRKGWRVGVGVVANASATVK